MSEEGAGGRPSSPTTSTPTPSPPLESEGDGKKTPPTSTAGKPAATAEGGDKDVPAASASSSTAAVSPEDLASLVAAVKFAHPDYGARRVHREIAEVASTREPILSSVRLGDVKRVWKRMGLSDHAQQSQQKTGPAKGDAKAGSGKKGKSGGGKKVAPAAQQRKGGGGLADLAGDSDVIKMYTVGDASVRRVAEDYNAVAAARVAAEAEAIAKVAAKDRKRVDEGDGGGGEWFHFFLDVPADRSGQKPHQALINFSDNNNSNGGGDGNGAGPDSSNAIAAAEGSGSTDKAGGATGTGTTPRSSSSLTNGPSSSSDTAANNDNAITTSSSPSSSSSPSPPRTILKIQVAGGMGAGSPKTPMLLYNSDRTARTFIHPDDGEGYDRIRSMVTSSGRHGALGGSGGLKGYFYGRIRDVAPAAAAAAAAPATAAPQIADGGAAVGGGKVSPTPPQSSSALTKKKKKRASSSSTAAVEGGGGGGRIVSVDCSALAPDQPW